MTEVLSITQPEGSTHLGSSLRRSSSQSSFLLQNSPSYSRPAGQNLKSRYAAVGYDTSRWPASLPSSAPSSPRLFAPEFSNQPSYTSTPSSSLSLDDHCESDEEDVVFPSYDAGLNIRNLTDGQDDYFDRRESIVSKPSLLPTTTASHSVTPSASDTALPKSLRTEHASSQYAAGDDTSIEIVPTRHVDYLSHNWNEKEIWASWRHIVAKRNLYANSPRLENASWRTWTKCKYRLKTISPEALNW